MEGLTDGVMDWRHEPVDNIAIKIFGFGRRGCNAVCSMAPYTAPGIALLVTDTECSSVRNSRNSLSVHETKTQHLPSNVTLIPKPIDGKEFLPLISATKTDMLFLVAYLDEEFDKDIFCQYLDTANRLDLLTFFVASMPSLRLEEDKFNYAKEIIKHLVTHTDAIIAIDNDAIFEYYGNDRPESVLTNKVTRIFVSGVIEMVSKTGKIAIDLCDIRTVFMNSGFVQATIVELNHFKNERNEITNDITKTEFSIQLNNKDKQLYAMNLTSGERSIGIYMTFSEYINKTLPQNSEYYIAYFSDCNFINKAQAVIFSTGHELS